LDGLLALESNRSREFGEGDGDALGGACVDREFVVAAAEVLQALAQIP
jgi:hypothetical protein